MKIILSLRLFFLSFALSGCVSGSTSYWNADTTDAERDKQYDICVGLSIIKFPKRMEPTGEKTTECTSIASGVKCVDKALLGDLNEVPRLKDVQSCMESRGYIKRY